MRLVGQLMSEEDSMQPSGTRLAIVAPWHCKAFFFKYDTHRFGQYLHEWKPVDGPVLSKVTEHTGKLSDCQLQAQAKARGFYSSNTYCVLHWKTRERVCYCTQTSQLSRVDL